MQWVLERAVFDLAAHRGVEAGVVAPYGRGKASAPEACHSAAPFRKRTQFAQLACHFVAQGLGLPVLFDDFPKQKHVQLLSETSLSASIRIIERLHPLVESPIIV